MDLTKANWTLANAILGWITAYSAVTRNWADEAPLVYSVRSAFMGSIDAARRAGR
jgi:hypothetical protein